MASFGWKRKVGEKVSKSVVRHFEAEEDDKAQKEGVDWQHATKRRRDILLEDCAAKSKRLKDEGAHLAEQGRHREAVKKWDEAIHLSPEDPALYEMKSQVLTILQEAFPAVAAAETAVKLRPLGWEGWQTLGRAQLNLGEVDLAVRSFEVAVHLQPSEPSLWRDDLAWARRLQQQRRAASELQQQQEEEQSSRRTHDVPELQHDYDFESDEVLAACEAVARRQTHLQEARRSAVVVDAQGDVREVALEEAGEGLDVGGMGDGGLDAASKGQFVKARGL